MCHVKVIKAITSASLHENWKLTIYAIFRCNLMSDDGPLLTEKTKFNIVEIQEMFENYLEKKELTLEVSFNLLHRFKL